MDYVVCGENPEIIAEGKTKVILVYPDDPKLVVVRAKNDITAFDDKKYTRRFASKGASATTTTCRVFELLKLAVSVAYERQLDDTAFLSPSGVTIIPLEVIARRYVMSGSSYLKRFPNIPATIPPFRFDQLVVDFDLKTTKGRLIVNGEELVSGLDAKKGEEDPLIEDVLAEEWKLLHSKKPASDPDSDLKKSVLRDLVCTREEAVEMDNLVRRVFLILECAWKQFGFHFIDVKIEFGRKDGRLLVADVIDADSWRMRSGDWKTEYSKQVFRDILKQGDPTAEQLDEIAKRYEVIAQWADKLFDR